MDSPETFPVGTRIAVWGVTGSGKTTFAERLGSLLGYEVIELDAIRHARGWDSVDFPEFRAILTDRLDSIGDRWLVEGSYTAIMDVYLSRIDTMVWLHLPWHVSFWRLLKRTVGRGFKRTQLYTEAGPRESLLLSFFSPRSILWWSISAHRRSNRARRERFDALPAGVRVYELRSSREIEAFRGQVEGALEALR